jgi:hypothetical protein
MWENPDYLLLLVGYGGKPKLSLPFLDMGGRKTWSIALGRLIVAQFAKKFLAFHRTYRFISVFTKGCDWYPSCQINLFHNITVFCFIEIHFTIIIPSICRRLPIRFPN